MQCRAQQQERQQVHRVDAAADHQRRADHKDEPQERRRAGDEVHQRLLADEGALPRHQEVDVLVCVELGHLVDHGWLGTLLENRVSVLSRGEKAMLHGNGQEEKGAGD